MEKEAKNNTPQPQPNHVDGVKPTRKRAIAIKKVYPTRTLEDALIIAYKIKEYNGGNPWNPKDVAAAVGSTGGSTTFYYWTAASRDYGITEGTRDTAEIRLTELGRKIVYAPNASAELNAKIEAFFSVKIFKDVYDYYGGSNLPDIKYLSNTLQSNFGLDPSIHEEFINIFKANCKFLYLEEGIKSPNGSDSVPSPTRVIAEPVGKTRNNLTIFVALPFVERNPERPEGFFNEVINNLIVPAATEAGFKVETANRQGSDIIQSTIINELMDADLVLADLTDHNPNVLFELGFRIAINKPVVIIKAKGTKGIFDVDTMMRYYEYNPNLWKSTLERDLVGLKAHIEAAWSNKDNQQSYITILTRR